MPGSVRCNPSTRMSLMTNGLKPLCGACASGIGIEGWEGCGACAAAAAAASRHAASTARAIPERSISAAQETIEVVVEGESHHDQQQRKTHALPELHRALGHGPAFYKFDRIVHEMPAIEQRDRQQVEHAQTDADERKECEVISESHLRRLTGEIRNGHRPGDVLPRDLPYHHLRQHLQA